MFCFGNEAAVLCSVSKTCGPGSCGCCSGLPIQLHSVFRVFLQIRMHSAFKMHPYPEEFVARDYFPEANASLFERIRCQELLFHGKCILIRKNSPPGIIFPRRMHPYSEKFVARDYFPEANASLSGRIRRQGLFSRGECIPIRKNSSPGIIFSRRMHPYSEKFVARDYFPEANASLFGKFRRQGLLFHGKCIPDELFR